MRLSCLLWGEPGVGLWGAGAIRFLLWSFRAGWQGLLFVFGGSGLAAGFSLGGEGSFDWATRVTSLRA